MKYLITRRQGEPTWTVIGKGDWQEMLDRMSYASDVNPHRSYRVTDERILQQYKHRFCTELAPN